MSGLCEILLAGGKPCGIDRSTGLDVEFLLLCYKLFQLCHAVFALKSEKARKLALYGKFRLSEIMTLVLCLKPNSGVLRVACLT